MDDENNVSEVVTAIYFVGLNQYKDCNVVSVTADPEELIGEDGIFITGAAFDTWYLNNPMSTDGIFERGWTENYESTNFWKQGRQNEVLGNVQILENSTETLNQTTGIRTQGGYNRTKDKKSIQLFSRKVYSGNAFFDRKLFDEYDSHAFYISGSPDKAYFSEHYGVDADNVLFIKDSEAAIGEESAYLYNDMIEVLKDGSVTEEEKVEMLYESCDIQSLIDWLCFIR